MTTFSFTTGNPSNLSAGGTANMIDISGSLTDLRTFVNGSIDGDNVSSTAGGQLGLSSSVITRRGKTNIAATESRTNVAYGTLTIPDQVTGIVLPTDGLIVVAYQAIWQNSVAGAARACIDLSGNQLKQAQIGAAPIVQEATGPGGVNQDEPMGSAPSGLVGAAGGAGNATEVTTGQLVGSFGTVNAGGPCYIFAAAGTYTVSVQFKSSSGSVTVKNRHLWVWTLGF